MAERRADLSHAKMPRRIGPARLFASVIAEN